MCVYVCMYRHHIYSRVWINRVRLPILLAVSWTGKMNIPLSPYVPESLVSRDGFSRPISRQPVHSPYSGWIWCLLTGFLLISAAAFAYLSKPPYAIGSVPTFLSGHAIAYQWRSLPRAAGPGPIVLKVVPVTGATILQVAMDQLICASLSHTHYWYEVVMLKEGGFELKKNRINIRRE